MLGAWGCSEPCKYAVGKGLCALRYVGAQWGAYTVDGGVFECVGTGTHMLTPPPHTLRVEAPVRVSARNPTGLGTRPLMFSLPAGSFPLGAG